jgi:DNA-binding NarL/FixJ family response regulator
MFQVGLLTNEPVLAAGLKHLISMEPDLELAIVDCTLTELIQTKREAFPGILLIDIETGGLRCENLAALLQLQPDCKIVLWVNSISLESAYQAMAAGVKGILRRTLQPETQVGCLLKVAQGELWFEHDLLQQMVSVQAQSLTRREADVIRLLSQGLKNKEIAEQLYLSEGTVKVYLSRLFRKLGVKDRYELAIYGLRNSRLDQREPRGAPRMEFPRRILVHKLSEDEWHEVLQ